MIYLELKLDLFFRVNYDRENWEKITETLKTDHKSIHRTNRAQLVDDCLSLAKAGIVDYSIALNLIEYLTKEKDYIPWSSALLALDYIQQGWNSQKLLKKNSYQWGSIGRLF